MGGGTGHQTSGQPRRPIKHQHIKHNHTHIHIHINHPHHWFAHTRSPLATLPELELEVPCRLREW